MGGWTACLRVLVLPQLDALRGFPFREFSVGTVLFEFVSGDGHPLRALLEGQGYSAVGAAGRDAMFARHDQCVLRSRLHAKEKREGAVTGVNNPGRTGAGVHLPPRGPHYGKSCSSCS